MTVRRIAVDIGGGSHDKSALVVARYVQIGREMPVGRVEYEVQIEHIEELPATAQPIDATEWIIQVARAPELAWMHRRGASLSVFIDRTGGHGAGVVDLLTREQRAGRFPNRIVPVTISPGQGPTSKWRLVTGLITAYSTGNLRFAPDLGEWQAAVRELTAFEPAWTPTGQVTFKNDPKLAERDDIVTALSLATYYPRYLGGPAIHEFRALNQQIYPSFAAAQGAIGTAAGF